MTFMSSNRAGGVELRIGVLMLAKGRASYFLRTSG